MAKLTRDDVFKLGQLACIHLSEDEIEHYAEEISSILEYVEQLASVDIDDLKPTNQVTGLSNVWREDEVIDYGYKPQDLLKNVPKTDGNYIHVGRMIE